MLESKENFEAVKDEIMAIPKSEVTYCRIPMEVATAEASQLAAAAEADRPALLTSGIPPSILDLLPVRAAAFLYAAAMFIVASFSDPEALRKWKELSPRGYLVFRYLKRMMTFAYRGYPECAAAMDRIRDGRGHKNMILNLLSLHLLATEHPEPLAALPMLDMRYIDEAKTLHEQLSDIYAHITTDSDESVQTRDVMNRAYTYYKEVADVVKEHGQFVFEGTPRYAAYISTYCSDRSKGIARTEKTVDEDDEIQDIAV